MNYLKLATRVWFYCWDNSYKALISLLEFIFDPANFLIFFLLMFPLAAATTGFGFDNSIREWHSGLRWSMGLLAILGTITTMAIIVFSTLGIWKLFDLLRKWAFNQ